MCLQCQWFLGDTQTTLFLAVFIRRHTYVITCECVAQLSPSKLYIYIWKIQHMQWIRNESEMLYVFDKKLCSFNCYLLFSWLQIVQQMITKYWKKSVWNAISSTNHEKLSSIQTRKYVCIWITCHNTDFVIFYCEMNVHGTWIWCLWWIETKLLLRIFQSLKNELDLTCICTYIWTVSLSLCQSQGRKYTKRWRSK